MLDCENMTWKLCELAALFYFIYSFLDVSDFCNHFKRDSLFAQEEEHWNFHSASDYGH